MSSTTDRRQAQSGQVLLLFAGGLLLMFAIMALVFDVGQNLLDRRTDQNAADAAALAGARYIADATYTYHGGCATPGSYAGMSAVVAACDVAVANGYRDGINNKSVRVDTPPLGPGPFANFPKHIQVSIASTRGSFFQGVLGVAQQRVAATAVATNRSDISLPYSLLALDPSGCGTNKITGSPGAAVITNGTVHVDSNCPSQALLLSGNGVLTAPECDVVGNIQTSGGAVNRCTAAPTGVLAAGDPLKDLPPPVQPAAPLAVQPLDGGPIPRDCPGGSAPATDAAPATCAFTAGPVAGKTYRIFPGNYPGGIATSKATLYMSPGIYWIGGGGVQIQSDGRLISKAVGDNTGTAPSGGVLIYNTADPAAAIVTGCVSAPTGPGCFGQVSINGGGGTPTMSLLPIETGTYTGMVMFLDRTKTTGGDDISLNGSNAVLNITGTIYAPKASVKLNGSNTSVVSAQIIAWSFQINGSGAGLTIDYAGAELFHLKGVGLVQ